MLVAKGKEFPFLLVSPQCPHDAYWSVHVLERLIDNIESRYRIDKSHIYVTGLSLGGLGTWNLGMASPERFAAIAPICGWGDPAAVPALKSVPVWTFHGKKDKIVSIEKTRKLVRALKACGGKVRFTIYPEAGHDAWTVTYNNPAFYRWLLRQRLPHRRITPE
jgi:predicted peptidase